MKNILLIEDDVMILDVYKRVLIKGGFSVDVAVDGEDGLRKISEKNYDMILLDIMLPKVDGLVVLKNIRKDGSKSQETPVMVLTNLGRDEIIKEAFKLGADGYLIKAQINLDNLLNEIENLLSKKEQGKVKTPA